jgi:hypothetical protein
MARGQTIRDRFHGRPPVGAKELARRWNDDLTNKLLTLVWEAYDQLHTDLLSRIPWNEDYDDLERSISRELEQAIQDRMDGFLPVKVQHGPPEHESKSPPPARPPEYDIAFVWIGDARIMWPVEAKVLKTDDATQANIGDYVTTVKQRFLTCYYAPFSNGGAMVGYLKQGEPATVLDNIAIKLGVTLSDYSAFSGRHHKISDHSRKIPLGKDYPKDFRCHHLILPLE